MIEIEGLGVCFGRGAALAEVSLQLPRREFVLLAGANGAGKTTLLRVLAGTLFPSCGRVRIGGGAPRPESRRSVAYLSSTLGFYDSLRLSDAVRLYGAFYSGYEFQPAADYRFDMGRRLQGLSRGEKTLFLLSLALSAAPAYLLVDDVLHFLDPHLREAFLQTILRHMEEREMGVILAAQSAEEVEGIAERLIILDRGRVVLDEPVERLRRDFVRVLADELPDRLPVVFRRDWQGGKEFFVYPCPPGERLPGLVEHLTLAGILRALVGGTYDQA
jgi:ABC-type multidrug transport system ATPase subunit